MVAKAILFIQADKIIRGLQFGGYKANIVTYTLALISHRSAQRIDLESIWEHQQISPAIREAIVLFSGEVFQIIANPPGQQNITEYCKKETCWKAIREISLPLPISLQNELIDLGGKKHKESITQESNETKELIDWVTGVASDEWFAISNWGKMTQNLQPWQRSLSFSLGRLLSQGKPPTQKQARQGKILHEKALELGFVFEEQDSMKMISCSSRDSI